jgi:hypothetical protein
MPDQRPLTYLINPSKPNLRLTHCHIYRQWHFSPRHCPPGRNTDPNVPTGRSHDHPPAIGCQSKYRAFASHSPFDEAASVPTEDARTSWG